VEAILPVAIAERTSSLKATEQALLMVSISSEGRPGNYKIMGNE
jgi:hypothetical protein